MKANALWSILLPLFLGGCELGVPFSSSITVTIDGKKHTIVGSGQSDEDFNGSGSLDDIVMAALTAHPTCKHVCFVKRYTLDGQEIPLDDNYQPTDPNLAAVWPSITANMDTAVAWTYTNATTRPIDLAFTTGPDGKLQPSTSTAYTPPPPYDVDYWGTSIVTTPPTTNTTTSSMVPSN